MKATLALENGIWYDGEAAGATGETGGEVVFNTSMTGYQEVLTDPSYAGQIVTMTCPEIGNYGVALEDGESRGPKVAGFVIRDRIADGEQLARRRNAPRLPGPQQHRGDLRHRHARVDAGAAIGGRDARIVATGDVDPRALVDRARELTPMEGSDLVVGVTCKEPFDWQPSESPSGEFTPIPERRADRPLKIAAYDSA